MRILTSCLSELRHNNLSSIGVYVNTRIREFRSIIMPLDKTHFLVLLYTAIIYSLSCQGRNLLQSL
jgi:hypothetical protein